MSASFDLPSPVRVTVGAVGPPGKRVFYFQARQADELVSLKLEKEQVLFLAGGLSEVLADLATPGAVPDEAELELEEPVLPAWSVGSMQLAYDPANDRVVLLAREIGGPEGDEDADEDADEVVGEVPGAPEAVGGEPAEVGVARVVLTREQAAGVIEHGKRLLRGGRPACPSCGFPLDDQHSCPKMNGHHAPSL
jgi:uncharacterized repeat protein (TIGR03847 family)